MASVYIWTSISFFRSVEYLGHCIDTQGVHTFSKKVHTGTKTTTCSRITLSAGSDQLLRQFHPKPSSRPTPFHNLLHIKECWSWSKQCQNAFKEAKQNLTSMCWPTMTPNCNLPCRRHISLQCLSCDIPHHAQFFRTPLPPAHLKTQVSATRCKWKRAHTPSFGIMKFHHFPTGFTLITKYRPLTTILGP